MNSDLEPGEIQDEVDMDICGSSSEDEPEFRRGVKRPRPAMDEDEPMITVSYKHLTRDSKRKLTELLLEWSQYHTKYCSSSTDSGKESESGELDTIFPAIQVGNQDKSQAFIPYSMENKSSWDDNSVPIYDRSFSTALSSEDGSSNLGLIKSREDSRCFNCGSYSHALKECTKPRDVAAINNARRQHVSRRIQNASGYSSARYYQSKSGGKFDGLKPGKLDSETRRVLGLGELDPPPWFNRMQELGYPPAYLDVKEKDQSSGITIYGEDENVEDNEAGERKTLTENMSVIFPGLNAPIPEKANENLWYKATNRDSRYNHASDSFSTSRFYNHEQRPPNFGRYDDFPTHYSYHY